MADYQQTIDEIRFKLQSDYCELTDELRQLAADYAVTCSEVNARLRRCGEYLKQGLRSEAINLAESDPNLLDLVALLDFPEREQFDELLGMYEIPVAEPLLLHVAESLNESYAAEQPLQKLLDQHRLLALTHAPLTKRLTIVRKLRDLDPTSHFWEDDVNEYERARLQEVKSEADEAAARNDTETLHQLAAELSQHDWQQTPSPGLVKRVRKLAGKLKRNDARDELQQLAEELNNAFSALDLTQARALRTQWETTADRAKVKSDDPLCEQVAPVLGWVEDEDARELEDQDYQRAIAALERALDRSGGSPATLEKLGHNVRKFERDMPETLAIRYRNQLDALQTAETRHRKMIIGSSAVMLLLVLSIIVVVIRSNLRATEMRRIAQSAESLIEKGQLAESRKLLDAHSEMSTSDFWLAANQKLVAAEKEEEIRQSKFRLAIESAQEANSYSDAMFNLKQATAVVATDDEKLQVARIERGWEQQHQQNQSKKDTDYRNRIRQVTSDIARLERVVEDTSNAEQFDELAEQVRSGIRILISTSPSVSPQLASQSRLLRSRLEDLEQSHDTASSKARLIETLTENSQVDPGTPNAAKRIDDFAAALAELAEKHADDPRASAFRQAAGEADVWRGVIAYMRMHHVKNNFVPMSQRETESRLEECKTYLTKHAESPYVDIVREYVTYLECIRRRVEGVDGDSDEGVNVKVNQLFSGPLMEDVDLLKSKDGELYYLTEKADFSANTQASFQFMIGFDGKTAGTAMLVNQLVSSRSVPAPHAEIARTVRRGEWIGKIEQWEPYFEKLTSSIYDNAELDSFLKYLLLLRTLEYAAEGSPSLAVTLKDEITELRQAKVDLTLRWMDPRNEEIEPSRKEASRALGRLKGLASAWKESAVARQQLQRRVGETTVAVGWLNREASGVWICETKWQPKATYVLRVARPVGADTYSWKAVGSANAETVTISTTDNSALREGRIVFAFQQADVQVGRAVSQGTGVSK